MTINWFSVSKALAVRCLLTLHVIMCVWRVVEDLRSSMYWLLLCGLIPLIVETCYTLIRRQGVEFSRFTPCFLFYLGAVLPGIWLLELDKTDLYIKSKVNSNSTDGEDNKTCESCIQIELLNLSPKTWLIVIEEMLPYVMFISRWVLPRGRVRREELAELLFAFIEIAADIMEFFSLVGDDVIRSNKTLAYCVLGIWSLSILQFTMTVTVIHQPKKEKKVMAVVVESDIDKQRVRVRHECFAIFLTIAMQDLPFAIMRLYTIINFSYINYSLIFFTSKNLIIIMLLLYKVAALCKKRYWPDHKDLALDAARNIDGAEKGTYSCQDMFAISKNDIMDKQQTPDKKKEQYIQHNHSKASVDSVLKKRSRKPETPKRESPDSGRTTPRSIVSCTTESEDTTSQQSIHLEMSDSRGYIPQLCLNCLSRLETTSDFHKRSKTGNLPSDLRHISGRDECEDADVSRLPHHTEDVEIKSLQNQEFIEESISLEVIDESMPLTSRAKLTSQTDETLRQAFDSPVTCLVLSIGNQQQQLNFVRGDASEGKSNTISEQ